MIVIDGCIFYAIDLVKGGQEVVRCLQVEVQSSVKASEVQSSVVLDSSVSG